MNAAPKAHDKLDTIPDVTATGRFAAVRPSVEAARDLYKQSAARLTNMVCEVTEFWNTCPYQSATALIVDDEKLVARTLANTLSEAGYGVTIAYTVDQAKELLKKIVFEVAVVDLKVGTESGAMLSCAMPRCTRLYLISGKVDGPSLEEIAENCNATAVLAKPFRGSQLAALVGPPRGCVAHAR